MNFDNPFTGVPVIPVEPDFDELANEEVMIRILVSGTEEEYQQLCAYHKLTAEQGSLIRFYARQRQQMVEKIWGDSAQRKQINPMATEEEKSMGAYLEDIESHVRDAVLALRRKGYPTAGSGYSGFEVQSIDLERPDLVDYVPSSVLLRQLEFYAIDLHHNETRVWFNCQRELSIEELKIVWDLIAADVPDLKTPVNPSKVPIAVSFREGQEKLIKNKL